jgi:hypothetical protein
VFPAPKTANIKEVEENRLMRREFDWPYSIRLGSEIEFRSFMSGCSVD